MMKHITNIFLACIIFTGCIFVSMTSQKNSKYPQVRGEGHETVPDNFFIPDAFFKKYNLDPAVRSNPRIKDWTSMDEANKYVVVNDIRWEFDKPEQALNYHKANLVVNSQKGIELNAKISIPGVQELHVYKEATSIETLNNDLGINTMEYGYLFVVENVVVKVWVKVNGKVSVEEASLFAREAAKTVQKALAK